MEKQLVPELRKQLSNLGLDTTGLKAVLIQRLAEYNRQHQQAPASADNGESDSEEDDDEDEEDDE